MLTFFGEIAAQIADWRVALDILVFAFVIYLLYHTLQTTGTWKIVLGLSLAAIGAGLANLVGLPGVEWIYSNLSQVTFVALIVIFQPELRKMLERTTSLMRGQTQTDSEVLPPLIAEGLFALREKGWGGIIVIPGKDSLRQWVTEGVLTDAVASLPLLLSIFDPDSPGHDGAALIENSRISRIGVRLPLSQTDALPEEMGTRHHASMGLAEKTDALILTVSEERAVISIFHRGEMHEAKGREDIVSRILTHRDANASALAAGDSGGWIWKTVLEIGISLCLAVLFWTTVVLHKMETREMIFTVPVQYSGLQKNLAMEKEMIPDVKVHLEGPTSILSALDLSNLRVQVDLSQVTAGRQKIALSEQNVQVAKKLKVVEIEPSYIDLEVKNLLEKNLPIKPQLVGSLPAGLVLSAVDVIPTTMKVRVPDMKGEASKESSQLLTTPIYLNGLKESTTVYCKIIAPTGFQSPDRRWPDVEVRIKISARKVTP